MARSITIGSSRVRPRIIAAIRTNLDRVVKEVANEESDYDKCQHT
jgi:hypothetical protein